MKRQSFKFFLRRSGILILSMLLLWGSFYIYYEIKGNRDLAKARAELVALGEPMDAAQIIPKPVPDEENAALVLKKAATIFALKEKAPFALNETNFKKDQKIIGLTLINNSSDREIERYRSDIKEYQEALSIIQEALQKPKYNQNLDYTKGPSILMLHLGQFKALARLLIENALVEQRDGCSQKASESLLSIHSLSQFLTTEPILISELVAIAMDNMSYIQLAPLVTSGQLNEETLNKIQMTVSNLNYRKTLSYAQEGERLLVSDWVFKKITSTRFHPKIFIEFFGPYSRDGMPLYYTDPEISNALLHFYLNGKGFWKSDQAANMHYHALLAKQLQSDILGQKERKLIHDAELHFPKTAFVTRQLYCVFWSSVISVGNTESNQKLILLACALERYRLAEKNYPAILDLLKSGYISDIPKDPFSGDSPIYKTDGKNYLLYYKGEDQIDEHGDPRGYLDISLATDKNWLPPEALKK